MASTAAQVQPGYLDDNGNWHPYGPNGIPSFNITTATNGLLAVTDASKTLHLTGTGNNYLLSNGGTNPVAVAVGGVGVTVAFPTADTVGGGMVVLPGAIFTVSTSPGEDSYVAAICSSGQTSTLYISQGSGS